MAYRDKATYNAYMRNYNKRTDRNAYMREYNREKHPKGCHENRRRSLMAKYGLTPEQVQQMIESQNGNCALCEEPLDLTPGAHGYDAPVVDHNHACCSGQKSCGECIRGVIHRRCNIGLGAFRDSPGQLFAAMSYLEKFR